MICFCSQSLSSALKVVSSAPALTLDFPLPSLKLELGGLAAASILLKQSARLDAMLAAGFPTLSLPSTALIQLSATLNAVSNIKMAFGIDLFSASASSMISPLSQSINANLSQIASLGLNATAILELGALASALIKMNAMTGINLVLPGSAASLEAFISAMATASLVVTPELSNLAKICAALSLSSSLGVGLGAPLNAKLELLASLVLPKLNINLSALASVEAILSALVCIKMAFGLNPLEPKNLAALKLAIGKLDLSILAKVNLAATAQAGVALSAIVPMLNIDLSIASSLSLNLPKLALPNLSNLSLVASLALGMKNLGIPAIALSPCASTCAVASLFS